MLSLIMKMMQAGVSGRLAITVLCTTLVVATTASSATTAVTFVLTSETLLSGSGVSLTDCDPDPTAGSCRGGLTSIVTIARRHALVTDSESFLLPKLDTTSPLPKLHPLGVKVNTDYYDRINSQYPALGKARILGYFADPSDIAGEGDSSYASLKRSAFSPLSSTMIIPPDSDWRFMVEYTIILDLVTMEPISVRDTLAGSVSNAKCAILRVDDADSLWTTSTRVSPLKYGTRVEGDHLTSTGSTTYSTARTVGRMVTTARSGVGLVIIIGADTTIPLVTLLEDMLALEIEDEYLASTSSSPSSSILYSYLPDVYVDTTGGTVQPAPANITVTYMTPDGQSITKTKFVLVAGAAASSSSRLEFILDLALVQAATGRLTTYDSSATAPLDPVDASNLNIALMSRTVANWLRDTRYYDDLAYFLGYSRAALANDGVVGSITEDMPEKNNATLGFSNCYSGECAQGTLIARALRVQLDADVSFVSSGIPQGDAWPAGNITQSYLYGTYLFVDTPCRAVMTGLRLWRIVTNAFAIRAYTSTTGARFLQASGMRITYAVQTTGYAKVAGIDVLNRTSGVYEPLERLRYYSVASTNYHCTQWQQDVFIDLYSGESIDASFSRQVIPTLMADYLTANNPHTPLYDNYFIQITADNDTEYLDYPLGFGACNSNQSYDAGVDSCLDCPEGYERSMINISRCDLIPDPPTTPTTTASTLSPRPRPPRNYNQ